MGCDILFGEGGGIEGLVGRKRGVVRRGRMIEKGEKEGAGSYTSLRLGPFALCARRGMLVTGRMLSVCRGGVLWNEIKGL